MYTIKNYLIYSLLFFLSVISVKGQEKESKLNLITSMGYGTENNYGHTAFYAGIGINKKLTGRFSLETNVTYFTTAIYNAYKENPTFYLNGDRWYNSLFLNLNAQYLIGNPNSLINARFKVGPALKYFDYKSLRTAKAYFNPLKRLHPIVPGTEIYYMDEGINVSLFTGLSVDAKVNSSLRMGLFVDVYSNLIPIEHFMPGIFAKFHLNKDKKLGN